MKKTQKFIVNERGLESTFYIISEDIESNRSPLFCDVCNFVMNRAEDSESFKKFKCCHECSLKFAQPRSKDWTAGWRPEKKDIDIHKKEIESRQQVLFFSHDN